MAVACVGLVLLLMRPTTPGDRRLALFLALGGGGWGAISLGLIEPLFSGEDVLRFHGVVRQVPIAEELVRYAVRLAAASRPHQSGAPDFINDWTSWGARTRAGQFLVLGAKARALFKGRAHVTVDDLQTLAYPTLRHRIVLSFEALSEDVTADDVVKRVLARIPVPTEPLRGHVALRA